MTVIIDDRQDIIKVSDKIRELFHRTIVKTLETVGFQDPVEVSMVLVDNAGIRELNCEYRDIDRETDVLSFPMLEYEGYDDDGEDNFELEDLEGEIDPDTQEILLGDIVISLEKAKEQAEEYNHSLEREIGFLIVHGMLHLLGYDHIDEEDEAIMQQKAEEVLSLLGLHRG